MKKSHNSRTTSAIILKQVLKDKRSLTYALNKTMADSEDAKQQGLIQELCYGSLRWYYQLQTISQALLQKPLRNKDSDIHALILIGLYQLLYTRIPSHAAISETVAACRELKKPWASKVVNAVLREFQRQQDAIMLKNEELTDSKFAHPAWFIKRLQESWPQHWQDILNANNQYPPMSLRINPLKISRADYCHELEKNNIAAIKTNYADYGIQLKSAVPVTQLPGFNEGIISVQDEASQLIASIIDLKPGLRVLDACSAPGGKTAAMYEAEPNLKEIIALDSDESRLLRLKENQQRCGFECTVLVGDAGQAESWWDKQKYDRILIDAPCSATGVIRRHPDIKYLRQESDIDGLVKQQAQILDALWPLLNENGLLIYSTCSILPEENELQLSYFLSQHKEAKEILINANWGYKVAVGRQILPGQNNMDGFYYGCLQKTKRGN